MNEDTRGDGEFTMDSRFSPGLTTGRFKVVSQQVISTNESLEPLTLEYQGNQAYEFKIKSGKLNGLSNEINYGTDVIRYYTTDWGTYNIWIQPEKVGIAQIVITADYFYEQYILNIKIVDNIPES